MDNSIASPYGVASATTMELLLAKFFYPLLKASIALFIVIDTPGNIPIFLSLTRNLTHEKRMVILRKALFASLFLLIIFGLLGELILRIFGIGLNSLKIAGGILLFVISMSILLKGEWEEKSLDPESASVVPIAFPLLAGPGAITTVIIFQKEAGIFITMLSILVVSSVNFLILTYIHQIDKFLGKTGSVVISRLTGVFIAAIAIEYIISGLISTIKSP